MVLENAKMEKKAARENYAVSCSCLDYFLMTWHAQNKNQADSSLGEKKQRIKSKNYNNEI